MKIKDIGTLNVDETTFKLSDRSITAKVNGKTKAVINDIQAVKSMPFSVKVDLNVKFGSKLNKFMDSLYIGLDKTLYYIIDYKYHKLVCEMALNGNDAEFMRLNDRIAALTGLSVNILILNVQ